ncbi:MAG: S9 family peptidase [Ardenticatenia bacterium]|nr:S9 family peptidase [Ardenticatenia bacterium]
MKERPFGLWESPISPDQLAVDLRLSGVAVAPDGALVGWLEGRGDQNVVVSWRAGESSCRELTRGRRVRAMVGYGGGDFTLGARALYFADQDSGRLFVQDLPSGEARPISPAYGKASSPTPSPDGRWIAYIHHDPDGVDRLALVDARGEGWPRILHQGHDFYMQPRWSPDGQFLAFVAWDHPRMPWDGTTLYLARMVLTASGAEGALEPRAGDVRAVAGGDEVSVFQPEFSPDSKALWFVSDETGWGHLVRLDLADGTRRRLTAGEAEHGQPAWVQDMRSYAIAEDGQAVYAVRSEGGRRRLYRIDAASGSAVRVEALAAYDDIASVHTDARGRLLGLIASGSRQASRVLSYDTATGSLKVLARASGETLDPADLADPEALSWPGPDGHTIAGLYYAPTSRRFVATGRPPLIVLVHGGPTAQSTAGWNPACQFLATRGFGVLAVNHRGSTGYGRRFAQALAGAWGEADVDDAISGAEHLAATGRIDRARVAIMGGSAGGYTVLRAMTSRPEAFAVGVSMYGISDLMHLVRDTHKFEARYLDRLVGPLPQAAQVYAERSPIATADRIIRPLALYQGADDRAVPRAQADMMAAALLRRGIPHLYQVYEGEGHGWRRKDTIEHFWTSVAAFLERHLVYAADQGSASIRT